MSGNEKIFITSPTILCSAGHNLETFWKTLISGECDRSTGGIKKVLALNDEIFWAAMIDDDLLGEAVESDPIGDTRIARILTGCLSGLKGSLDKVISRYGPSRVALCLGSCDNGTAVSVPAHYEYFLTGDFPKGYSIERQGAGDIARFVASYCGVKGLSFSYSLACASSNSAVIGAARLLKAGVCDAVLCGGVDVASSTTLVGFSSLGAVSDSPAIPFSKNRRGITLGEGAAFFLMTRERLDFEDAVMLLGYGESCDAYHATSPDPKGLGAAKAMNEAISGAALNPPDIDYVNLHGTGTKLNDSAESFAMNRVFGRTQPWASSTKGLTGHTLGAAGAVELVACYLSLTCGDGHLPIHFWDGEEDDTLPALKLVSRDSVLDKPIKIAMSNTYGFGGANVSVILGAI